MAFARVVSPVLVGREAELSTLEDALLSALRGDGGVVIVGGEAGMGKTRLLAALSTRAQRLGCAVLSGGCSQAELSLPYLPFLEAVGNYLANADVAQLRERLGSAAEELAHLFPQMGKPAQSGLDAAQAKLRLFESMLLLLREAARTRAALLILEDLQWADPATRELLDYATRRLRNTSVLVVATYRSDELHRKHALLPTIQGWRRNGQVEIVELGPLGPAQVAEMVCAIFDEASISDEFRDFIHERTEGNPFVVEEMLREALDRGDIFRTETGWDRKSLVEFRLPRTVRDMILERLERLPREHVNVLSSASVIGRSFDIQTLSSVAGVEETEVLSALEASINAQLLDEEKAAAGHYRFRHALMQEAIYEDMVVPRRQQIHSRIADVLGAAPGSAQIDIAHHLMNAGRHDEAVAMCISAAHEATKALAFHDAAQLLERAAPYVRDAVERGRLMCLAGENYWNNSEPAAARALLEEGVEALESAGLEVEAAGRRLVLGRCYWELLRSDRARREFEKAKEVLEAHGPSEALAIAYIRLSGLISFDKASEESLAYAQRAVEIAQQVGAAMALAWSWNFLALAEVHLGRVQDGLRHLDDSYQAAMEGGYQFQASNAVFNAAWEAVHLGKGEQAMVWDARAGDPQWATSIWMPYIRSLVKLHQGQVGEATELARAALQRSRDAGHEKQAWRSTLMLALALAENMQGSRAVELIPPLSTRIEGQDTVYDTEPRIRTKLALGDVDGALEMAKTVSPDVADLASPVDVVAEAAQDDPSWLREFMEKLDIKGECLASPRLAAARGRLALYEGRFEEAVRELKASLQAFERGGLHLDAWHVSRALAEAEIRSGDPEAGRRRLQATVKEATAMGAHLAAHLAYETAERLGVDIGRAPAAAPAPASGPIVTGERLVSVLFADVRGYTALTGQTPPAELSDRIATLQRWAAQEVARRNGLVDKFAGDAIMATFNISGQTVDHARQAVRAAMGIIDKAALAGIQVGAAVAVGPAVVGSLTQSANVSVLGEATNLAARLQAQSEPGEISLSEEAYRRVKDWLDAQATSVERVELNLKGFAQPVTAYKINALAPAPQPA